jgi:putative transposase
MSQHLHVCLTDEQRQHLDNLIKRGNAPARMQNRARVLLLSDRSQGERRTQKQVAQATLCCLPTVGQICRRFVQEGLDGALSEKPRPGALPKITGDIEAKLVTLACSDPPEGRNRWTLRLLADKMVALGYLDSITNVTIGERLKKTRLSPGR